MDPDEFINEQLWIEAGWMRRDQPAPFRSSGVSGADAESRFLIDWADQHRESKQPADPAYPRGCAIDVALDAARACRVELSCPAKRCGLWVITCRMCGFSIALETAGRSDDPKSVRVPCRRS